MARALSDRSCASFRHNLSNVNAKTSRGEAGEKAWHNKELPGTVRKLSETDALQAQLDEWADSRNLDWMTTDRIRRGETLEHSIDGWR